VHRELVDTAGSCDSKSKAPMPVRSSFRPQQVLVASAVLFTTVLGRAADPQQAAPAPEIPKAAVSTPMAASAAGSGPSVELPHFRSGLWQYRRTEMRADAATPQVLVVKKCGDPGVDMREKMESLKKRNCQFAPLKKSAEHYVSSWICQTPTGALRFRDILTAKSTDDYEVISETHSPQRVTQQKLEATRLGECPGMGSGAPLTPTPKPPHQQQTAPPKA
jgi:hypothetical protein